MQSHVSGDVGTRDNMRCLLILGSLLVISVTYSLTSPCETQTDRGSIVVTDKPPVIQPPPDKVPSGIKTETTSHVSGNSSQIKNSSKTKDTEKIKTKELKDGSILTIIIDKHKVKNKTKELTDSYDQTNHTISEGGIEVQDSLTQENERKFKEVKISKNVTKEFKITAKNGTVISDKIKTKTSEKDKKFEKTKQSATLIHTVKKVTEAPGQCATVPPPRTTVPPSPPCETTRTTIPPTSPCDTKTIRPTSKTTTATVPPKPPCDTDTTTTEPPRLPCGCKRTTTTTEKPETWPCGHPKATYD